VPEDDGRLPEGMLPRNACTSDPHTPAYAILIRTSSGPRLGRSTSRTSILPVSINTAALTAASFRADGPRTHASSCSVRPRRRDRPVDAPRPRRRQRGLSGSPSARRSGRAAEEGRADGLPRFQSNATLFGIGKVSRTRTLDCGANQAKSPASRFVRTHLLVSSFALDFIGCTACVRPYSVVAIHPAPFTGAFHHESAIGVISGRARFR